MASEAADSPSWHESYRRELAAYESCTSKLELLIEDLLTEAGIDVVAVESRTKDPDSLLRKVEGKKDKYPKPLVDVMDLIGVRVITYYLEDVERIGEIIDREFVVDTENSTDKLDELEPDRFGYRSVHYIVSMLERRSGLTEWGVFGKKRAEIQLRTATQHAWAAVEHKLSYRRTREAPRDLRRRLTRLSALFEFADEQFSGVRDQLEEVEARYSDDVKGGNLDLPIDKASLDAFMFDNDVVADTIKSAEASGFVLGSAEADGYEERRDVDLRDLVSILDQVGVKKIAELDAMLNDDAMSATIARLGSASAAHNLRWATPVDALCGLILFHTNASPELAISIYNPSIVELFEVARTN